MKRGDGVFRRIGRASVVLVSLMLFDKVLAMIKEIIVADRFGISSELDVFYIAYALPGIVILFISGAVISAFVPIYIEWSRRFSRDKADAGALAIFVVALLFFGFLATGGCLGAEHIFSLMGYGFGAEEKRLGGRLLKWVVFLLMIDGPGILLAAMLHARKKFFGLQSAPLFINITTIVLLLFFYKSLGIYTLVWGFLAGAVLKFAYAAFLLHRSGFRFVRRIHFDGNQLLPFIYMALPLLGSELIANINLLVDQIMATQLDAGAVATLRYAFRVNDLPIQVIIIAISNAIFPFISEQAQENDYDGLGRVFSQSLVFISFLTIPIVLFVLLFSREIMALLFERGAFDATATVKTAQTLVCYNLGLFFYAYTFINGVFFPAIKETKPLLYMGLVSVFLNVAFNFIFMRIWGVRGIALSTTATLAIVAVIFMGLLKKRLHLKGMGQIANNMIRVFIAGLAMLVLGILVKALGGHWQVHGLVLLPAATVAMGLFYLGCCWILRTEEMMVLAGMFRSVKR